MNKFDKANPEQNKEKQTQDKLENMRSIVFDEQKCKEVAQKLCAYISKK